MSTDVTGTPKPAHKPIDTLPLSQEQLAAMTPEERSAVYLNSIRKTLLFLAALAAVGIVVGIVLALVEIGATHGLGAPAASLLG